MLAGAGTLRPDNHGEFRKPTRTDDPGFSDFRATIGLARALQSA
jgi:hypothetical protein